jgi:plasmid segregation protein ParM
MKNIVGNGSDIDNIILAGGGGYIYRKVVESFYPNRKIIMVDDAQLANVKGFYLAGLEHIAKAAPTDLF